MNESSTSLNIFLLSNLATPENLFIKDKLKSFINFINFSPEANLPKQAIKYIKENDIDFSIIDVKLYKKYIDTFPELEKCLNSPFLVLGPEDSSLIRHYMKIGAVDYIFSNDRASLIDKVENIIRNSSAALSIFGQYTKREAFSHIITKSRAMEKIFTYAAAVAKTDISILITGETGTGKEEMAKAIHKASGRSGEFVAVNVAGLDDKLFADTLFGHVKGAFTGATQSRTGLIRKANSGTLFLDEIGDLKIEGQLKLLRLLQEKEYYPLGADEFSKTDARILVATNCDLASLVKQGVFRKDLYFRLKAHEIKLPALRERKDDIPYLIGYFIKKACAILAHKKGLFVPEEIYTILNNYSFPGNIRELELMITDSIVVSKGNVLSLGVIKERIFKSRNVKKVETPNNDFVDLLKNIDFLPSVKEVNNFLIEEALKRTDNNKTQAAGLIGITRQTIDRYLRER